MKEKNNDRIQVTKMFMEKADNQRCFFGCIKKLKDNDGNPFVFSRILMPDVLLCVIEAEYKQLSKNLDEMCLMICDEVEKPLPLTTFG